MTLVGDRPDSPATVAALAQRAALLNSEGLSAEAIEVCEQTLPAAERLGLEDIRARLLELRGTSRIALGDEGRIRRPRPGDLPRHRDPRVHPAANRAQQPGDEGGLARPARARVAGRSWRCRRTSRTTQLRDPPLGRGARDRDELHARRLGRGAAALRRVARRVGSAARAMRWNRRADHAGRDLLDARGEAAQAAVEIAMVVDRANLEGEAEVQSLARAAFSYLAQGRRDEASALLSEVLGVGELMVNRLNDSAILDGSWTAYDLGLADEFAARLDAGGGGSWVAAARASAPATSAPRPTRARRWATGPARPTRGCGRRGSSSRRARRGEARRPAPALARLLARGGRRALRARGRGASRRFGVNEARLVAARVRLGKLVLVERADPL